MPFAHLLPIITVAATKGLGCGVACGGACGNPMTKMFLGAYLFTHSGKLKRSVTAFLAFYAGKITAVVLLCVIAALLGNRIIDDYGMLFGINLLFAVQLLIFFLALVLIGRWIYLYVKPPSEAPCGECNSHINKPHKKLPLTICGFISGISPCAPLILAVGYAATLSVLDAVIVGIVFSVASSVLPLLLIVVFTGVLSGAMFKEIPEKIRYFQLASYVLITAVSGYTIITLL
jgi:ABC-type nickel/cobalt efflux system permease component RcnA